MKQDAVLTGLPLPPGSPAADETERAWDRIEPPVRGEAALRAGDGVFQRLDAFVQRFLPAELNPLAQTGAIANTSLLIAIVSGIVLLIWYSTSVHHAYDSVTAMSAAPWTAGLVRSIHRYSSDACMLFVLVHAVKLFFARRFGGVRWLAWVTGIVLLGLLWLIGWLGYWLVWDERGQLVALDTARLLDALPIFADPLSRSFLVDQKLNSLLFFVVFFLHMLLPLAMGIALWLHITRLSRPHFLTGRWMTVWVVVATVLVSVLFPADVAGAAKMAVRPAAFSLDGWYLWPVTFADRLGSGALWGLVLAAGAVLLPVPWYLAKGRARVAVVHEGRCNGCEGCYRDCPYDAIQMVPRKDGKKTLLSVVDASKCVGCGICAGSCNSVAIGIGWFDTVSERHRIDGLVDRALDRGGSPIVALVCEQSAATALTIDARTGESPELSGYVVVRVPCAGWIHPLTIERALKRGARGVLVVSSGPGSCTYREGGKWTALRVGAEREPKLRLDKVDPKRVRLLELFRTEKERLLEEAVAFRDGVERAGRRRRRAEGWLAGVALAASFGFAVWGATRVGYAAPIDQTPMLVVSFKHPGQAAENCREPTPEELAKLPRHMQAKKVCERRRANVRLRVEVDGHEVVSKSYDPRGIWHDGNSIAIERIPLSAGAHQVKIEIGDTADPAEMNHTVTRRLTLREKQNAVVLFDKMDGFQFFD